MRAKIIQIAIFFIGLFINPVTCRAADSAAQRTIRNIEIVVRDVFDGGEDGLLYDAANSLKINTKADIVRRELLFKEGDVYDKFRIAESGRNLRSVSYLRDISIIEKIDGDFVDIVVSVQDTWTLFPVVSLSSGSGTQSQSIGIVEGNIAGYGKRFEALLAEDEGRKKYEVVWDDRRFMGGLQRFSLGHFERSDGRKSVLAWGLPFRSLVNKEAWFVDIDKSDLIGRLFRDGDERYIYRQAHASFMGGYTISQGNPSELLNRFTLGYSYQRDQFEEASESDYDDIGLDPLSLPINDGMLANDRGFSGPVMSWQRIEPDFISLNYVDLFGRVQDFNLGNELVAYTQIAPEVLGSQKNSLLFRVTDTEGFKITPQQFIRGQLSVSGRFDKDNYRELVLAAQARYYRVFAPNYYGDIYLGQHTFASAISFDSGYHLYNDSEFLLGASNGLRGYEDRTLSGDHRFNLNLEDRVHLLDDVASLVNIGAAVFADLGTVSNNSIQDTISKNIYSDVGVGLRFGLTRSSGGTVVRVDLAFPLRDGPDGTAKMEPRLLFTTGQLFSAFLRSDAPGLTTPSISAGFAK